MNDYALIEPEGKPKYFQRVQNFDGPITITGEREREAAAAPRAGGRVRAGAGEEGRASRTTR